jgi:hypothetical protein
MKSRAEVCRLLYSVQGRSRLTILLFLVLGSLGLRTASAANGTDLVGFWECLDPNTHWSIHDVEFKKDGTYDETHTRSGLTSGQYELTGSNLALFVVVPTSSHTDAFGRMQKQKVVMEAGTVEWLDPNLFRLRVTVGNKKDVDAGRQYEFHRLSGTGDSAKEGSLIGKWDRIDPNGQGIPRVVELDFDGTYQESGSNSQPDSRSIYKYQDTILSFFWMQDQRTQFLIERGQVVWIDKDRFSYRLLDGTGASQNLRGTVFEFRRQVTTGQ